MLTQPKLRQSIFHKNTNMKYSLLIIFLLIFCFSCDKDLNSRQTTCVPTNAYDYLENYQMNVAMCNSDICSNYLAIWKELIQEKNNLSKDYFKSHIELIKSDVHSWADGVSFSVCYKFKTDWAIAYNCDQFIIKINTENTLYPALDLPRDTYLTKEKIKIAVDNGAFSSGITRIDNSNNLKFMDMESALNDLIEFSGVNILCLNQVRLDEKTGHLILIASSENVNEGNSCIKGTIDLITGEKQVIDLPCWINFQNSSSN